MTRPDPSEWDGWRSRMQDLIEERIALAVRETEADGEDPGDQGIVTSWIVVWNQMAVGNDGKKFGFKVDWASPPHQPSALDVGMLIQASDDIRNEAFHEDAED